MNDEEKDIELDREDIDPVGKQASYGAGDSDLDDSVVAEEYQKDTIQKLKGKLKEAEGKAKEYLDGWQRTQADFTNIRKRDEEAKLEFLKYATQGLIEELIPVLDSFNIAMSHGNKEVEPVYKQFMSIMKARGLEELDPVGEAFDPRLHEAIGMTPTDKKDEDQKVIEVMQKGYKLGDKIVRAAKVRIGEFNG